MYKAHKHLLPSTIQGMSRSTPHEVKINVYLPVLQRLQDVCH